ncbi:hypothetical protein H206_05511 [Candidatus Electrothrix aarhusensis]|uniref:Uncharacterized protein n=1 Tax=Candidatus Electrothrix aarhusensis TaxID=1859131 RepID=A0A3S3R1H5_9BACT|nr:hypothetical protein H206_05511 [Candidatus Electrothrix aarhusensis]
MLPDCHPVISYNATLAACAIDSHRKTWCPVMSCRNIFSFQMVNIPNLLKFKTAGRLTGGTLQRD